VGQNIKAGLVPTTYQTQFISQLVVNCMFIDFDCI